MTSPWLYMYFKMQTKDLGAMSPCRLEQVAFHQLMMLVVPVLIGVARRGAWIEDFHDERPRYKPDNRS